MDFQHTSFVWEAKKAYSEAIANGTSQIEAICLIRKRFDLSLEEVKEVIYGNIRSNLLSL